MKVHHGADGDYLLAPEIIHDTIEPNCYGGWKDDDVICGTCPFQDGCAVQKSEDTGTEVVKHD